MGYDAFISYSHAADGRLAPQLQSGLQRFAKPWWRRRALHVFRDETGLSANPHLWASIEEALAASAWFVFLASPEAARSEWVHRELSWWITNRDPNRILPVLTDGSLVWDPRADRLDTTATDAVPAVLAETWTSEPRWIDLRWARDSHHLDLCDVRFRDAVADIAAPLYGVPKDDLASEEVRQHRRTVRTAPSSRARSVRTGAAQMPSERIYSSAFDATGRFLRDGRRQRDRGRLGDPRARCATAADPGGRAAGARGGRRGHRVPAPGGTDGGSPPRGGSWSAPRPP